MDLSIVVPVFDEAARIADALDALGPARAAGVEVIVVDGGSSDGTSALATAADRVLQSPKGRAAQMNAGAAVARGRTLLFLHVDSTLPPHAVAHILDATASHAWGRFDVTIEGASLLLRVVSAMMNARSRWSGIATGDQALFVRRAVFEQVGRFPAQPLMEDIELSKRLRAIEQPVCLRERVVTSGRRWERDGVLRTIALMWTLRLRYWLGASPDDLARAYR
ncbi:MAG: TIGR04283 family arsenosugar biosynthesis glycosyltransferase [Burkholderiaceae bacterium]